MHATALCRETGQPIIGLRHSRDGHYLASADLSRTLRVWYHGRLVLERDLVSNTARSRSLDRIRSFEISPGGYSIVIASGDCVREIELASGKELWRESRPPVFGFLMTCPKALALSFAGELALSYDDGMMETLPLGYPGRKLVRWRDHDAPFSMAYLCDAQTLVGTDGITVAFWNSRDGYKRAKWMLGRKICAVAASQSGGTLAIRTLHRVLIYDLGQPMTDNRQATIPPSSSRSPLPYPLRASAPVLRGLPSLAVSGDGSAIAAGDQLGVSIFDREGNLLDRYPQVKAATLSVSFVPHHHTLAIGSTDGTVVLWPYRTAPKLMPAFVL